jgi:hypothetical protein
MIEAFHGGDSERTAQQRGHIPHKAVNTQRGTML